MGQDGAVTDAVSPRDPNHSTALREVLERARRLGVLGPGPIDDHLVHAQGFVAALADVPAGTRVIDLGSGGGLPGLVIGEARPDLPLVLLDSLERRCALLREAVVHLGWTDRCEVVEGRAEEVGRDPEWRAASGAVTARSFGPPATLAECAAPLLVEGGLLVVSEPPGAPERWPSEGLVRLGLVDEGVGAGGIRRLRQVAACPAEFPRRVGLPAKRPLF